MKFHKSIYVLVAVFFLTTKIGFAFNLHYCGGQLAEVSAFFDHVGCEMEVSETPSSHSNEATITQKSCCYDEVLLVQNQDENPLSDVAKLSPAQLDVILAAAIILELLPAQSEQFVVSSYYHNEAHAPPFFQLYCSYTFYG